MRKHKIRKKRKVLNGLIILVEGKSEKNFLKAFEKEIKGKSISDIIDINANNPNEIINKIENQKIRTSLQEVWLVIDTEEDYNFDKKLNLFEEAGANVVWSNPCFEVALFEFLNSKPRSTDRTVSSYINSFKYSFKKETGKDYDKANENNFSYLNNIKNYNDVIKIIKTKYNNTSSIEEKVSNMKGITTLFELLERLIELN